MTLPNHVAIIMDGNGRWAKLKGRPRVYGHIKGARVARTIISEAARLGVKELTLFAFSTENWARPQEEVSFLMKLLHRYILKEKKTLIKENIQFSVIGDINRLPEVIVNAINESITETSKNTGLKLTFALNYGGRQELADVVKQLALDVSAGKISAEGICVDSINKKIHQFSVSDPDLVIRTSGEKRLSNFLLWQSAYSELLFSDTYWPDFSIDEFTECLFTFSQRQRRFGKISEQVISERTLQ